MSYCPTCGGKLGPIKSAATACEATRIACRPCFCKSTAADWHEEADAVGYWQTSSKSPLVRKTLVKKTNYPCSFSLTNAQYRMAMAGRFNGVTVVDSRTGARLFDENEFGLRDVLKTAVAKTTIDGVIYWVVRF